MTSDTIFTICSNLVLPGWLLLALAPRWKWTQPVAATILPILLATAYLVLLVRTFGEGEGGFGSLDGVTKLFADRRAVLVGWIHYLAFDLFIGAWEIRDSQRQNIPHLAVIPFLFLTLMLGPVGLLGYMGLRMALRRKWFVEDSRV